MLSMSTSQFSIFEIGLGIVCACLPALILLWRRYVDQNTAQGDPNVPRSGHLSWRRKNRSNLEMGTITNHTQQSRWPGSHIEQSSGMIDGSHIEAASVLVKVPAMVYRSEKTCPA